MQRDELRWINRARLFIPAGVIPADAWATWPVGHDDSTWPWGQVMRSPCHEPKKPPVIAHCTLVLFITIFPSISPQQTLHLLILCRLRYALVHASASLKKVPMACARSLIFGAEVGILRTFWPKMAVVCTKHKRGGLSGPNHSSAFVWVGWL